MAFRLRTKSKAVEAQSFAGFNVPNTEPADGDTLLYLDGAFEYGYIPNLNADGDVTLAGGKILTGQTQIGTGSTFINDLRFGTALVTAAPMAANAVVQVTVNFAPAFAAGPPLIEATASTATGNTDAGILVTVSALSASAVTFEVSNRSAVPTTSNPIDINWLAIR